MNINRKVLKLSAVCLTGAAIIAVSIGEFGGVNAISFTKEEPVAGISIPLERYYSSLSLSNDIALAGVLSDSDRKTDVVEEEKTAEKKDLAEEKTEIKATDKEKEEAIKLNYKNLGIAKVDNYLNIRKGAGEDKKIIGKLPKNAGCEIYSISKDGEWAKIKSGKVTGYVSSKYLVTGKEADQLAKKVGKIVATVNTTTLKVREKADVESICVTLVPIEEELEAKKVSDNWVKVVVDNDLGFVKREYVNLSYQLDKAVYNEEIQAGSNGVSSTRASMVNFAKNYLGNRYVWGGTSLVHGTDCSGFTQSIYRHFGYAIPRTSRSQAASGRTISSSQVKPGDLVFYSNGAGINHVAMYIGGGQVIHASNPTSGIKISNMNYRRPAKAVRYIND